MGTELVTRTSYVLRFLSPLHVGTEERLGLHDVVVVQGRLYRVAADRLLDELEQAPQARDRYLTGTDGLRQIEQWLRLGDRLRRLALYDCPVPREPRPREDLRPFLADLLGRPYVPGSQVKGAVRTAVLWQLLSRRADRNELSTRVGQKRNRRGEIERTSKQDAGQWLEQILLGEDPRSDAFRIVRVADTTPLPASALRVYPVLVAARQQSGLALMEQPRSGDRPSQYGEDPSRALANFCECLTEGTLRTSVEVDRYLLSKWDRDASFLERWPDACNAFGRRVAEAEKSWWEQARDSAPPSVQPVARGLVEFYSGLLRRLGELPTGHVVLNLGWGGGWRTKTVAEAFGDPPVRQLVQQYRLDRGSRAPVFPKTRKVAWLGPNRFAPLGWVLLELE